MTPLKKKIRVALGGKKRKMQMAQNKRRKNSKPDDIMIVNSDTIKKPLNDSINNLNFKGSLALLDTVIKIYYLNLNDSTLAKQKSIINSYINRVGKAKISDISLTDFYSIKESEETDKNSVKREIYNYLNEIGVSRHKVFGHRNKALKQNEASGRKKTLLYLEIRIH